MKFHAVTATLTLLSCLSLSAIAQQPSPQPVAERTSTSKTRTAVLPDGFAPSLKLTPVGRNPVIPSHLSDHCKAASDTDDDSRPSRLGLSIFSPTGTPSDVKADTGFGLLYERSLKRSKSANIVATMGLYFYHIDDNSQSSEVSADVTFIPLLVEYQFRLGKNFYIGPNVGVNSIFASDSGGDGGIASGSSLLYGVSAGCNFYSLFAEVRYMGTDAKIGSGLIFSLGGRF